MEPADLFRKLNALPKDKQAEVIDFIDFLLAKSGVADWSDAEFSQFSLTEAMRGLEDDPVEYTTDDLRERWA